MKTKRPLTAVEDQFLADAKAGGFEYALDDNGAPFALGAEDTDNLFSMEVESAKDGESWCYFLPDNTDLAARLR